MGFLERNQLCHLCGLINPFSLKVQSLAVVLETLNHTSMPINRLIAVSHKTQLPLLLTLWLRQHMQSGFLRVIDEKPNPKRQFRFEVDLNKPDAADGKSVTKMTDDFALLVEEVVATLSSRLK